MNSIAELKTDHCLQIVITGLVTGAVTFLSNVIYGIYYEETVLFPMLGPNAIRLSYGQQGFVGATLIGMLGGVLGASAVVYVYRFRFSAIAITGVSALWSIEVIRRFWDNSIADHGPDVSDHIVYETALYTAQAILGVSIIACIVEISRRLIQALGRWRPV